MKIKESHFAYNFISSSRIDPSKTFHKYIDNLSEHFLRVLCFFDKTTKLTSFKLIPLVSSLKFVRTIKSIYKKECMTCRVCN